MLFLAVFGTSIALIPGIKLLWIFLIYGTLAAAGVGPVLLAVFGKQVSARGVFYGASAAVSFGLPLSIYANVTESQHLVALASAITCLIGFLIPLIEARFSCPAQIEPQITSSSPRMKSNKAIF